MKQNVKKGLLPYIMLFIIIITVVYFFNVMNQKVNNITYNNLLENIGEGKVEELTITPKSRSAIYEITGRLDNYKEKETFKVMMPLTDEVIERILDAEEKHEFDFNTNADPEGSSFMLILINVLPIMLLIGATFFIVSRQIGGASKSMDFGRSRAKLNVNNKKVTFKNVAGLVEEKEEVSELIDFLKNPKKFTKMGARIPKGVLLVGSPGTGKTLLARAVAGEANVPFYYISGSEFVELFVGVGASRVRDMFKQAKNNAPCLIFIDEIDAVGRQRGTGVGGGHDEREQTLNQLLTEMDGFGENEGIIVIAATNRPDVLDPALLRPGRFDRRIVVNLPDAKGRKEILEVHAQNKKLSSNVTFKYIAQRTAGFSGADLENLLNEAALLAVRRGKERISLSEVDEGMDRVLMGPAKKSIKYSEKDKRSTAIHEAGHAVIGIKSPEESVAVQKITIIPRGMAGGYTSFFEKEEKRHVTKTELLENIKMLLGGRAAQELILGEKTTGAVNDFERATKIARAMVTEYGMSDLGPLQLEHREESIFLGRDYAKTKNFSDQVALEIDKEVRKIINECYDGAIKTLKDNKKLLELIADKLVEHEVLTKEQIDYLVIRGKLPEEEQIENLPLKDLKKLAKVEEIKDYSTMTKEELIKAINKR
ncbi:MAG: ATP-dependent zinc metalloprotease FtsH [Bacilli bacterium]